MKEINIEKMRKEMALAEHLLEAQSSIREQLEDNRKFWDRKYFYQVEKYVGQDNFGIDMWDTVAHVNTDLETVPFLAMDYITHFCIYDCVRIFKCEREYKNSYTGILVEKWNFKMVRNSVFEPLLK
jgi:hypothetical protein